MLSRRSFVKALAAVGGALLLPLDRLAGRGSAPAALAQEPAVGELYAGFVLLPENALVPAFVKPARLGIPKFSADGAAASRSGAVITKLLSTAKELAAASELRLYEFTMLPDGVHLSQAVLCLHPSGEVYSATLNYLSCPAVAGSWGFVASISAEPDFPRPFPIRLSRPLEPAALGVIPEKVDCLPCPGIALPTCGGYFYQWIENDVHYTAILERGEGGLEARQYVRSLVRVG